MLDKLLQPDLYQTILQFSFIYVVLIAIGGFFGPSPYGRFGPKRSGLTISPRWGWMLMELPATLSFLLFYFQGQNRFELVPLIFLGVWLMHYGNRGFVFPFLMRIAKGEQGSFSFIVIGAGWLVTAVHGYLNAVFISHLGEQLTPDWLMDPRFIIGAIIYLIGFTLNVHSDAIVRNLRSLEEIQSGEKIYRIPQGGLFRYVTNPSYFTELVSFTGFAIACWSAGAVFVLLVSAANLIPRAFQVHKWYIKKFGDEYPSDRKVLVPFII